MSHPFPRPVEQLLPQEVVYPASPTTSLPNWSWNTLDHPPRLLSRLVHGPYSLYMGIGEGGTTHILLGLENIKTSNRLVWRWRLLSIPAAAYPSHRFDSTLSIWWRRKSVRHHASAFVEVAINLGLAIVLLYKYDGLFEIFSAMKRLPWVIDEILELIGIGIVTDGPPSHGMYLDFQIFFAHQFFPGVSLLCIRFQSRRMGWGDASVEAINVGDGLLSNWVERRGRDTAIRFRGFCQTVPMRWVQLLT